MNWCLICKKNEKAWITFLFILTKWLGALEFGYWFDRYLLVTPYTLLDLLCCWTRYNMSIWDVNIWRYKSFWRWGDPLSRVHWSLIVIQQEYKESENMEYRITSQFLTIWWERNIRVFEDGAIHLAELNNWFCQHYLFR